MTMRISNTGAVETVHDKGHLGLHIAGLGLRQANRRIEAFVVERIRHQYPVLADLAQRFLLFQVSSEHYARQNNRRKRPNEATSTRTNLLVVIGFGNR